MATEPLPTQLTMESDSGNESPRPRSNSAIVREIEQVLSELNISDEAHRREMAEINRALDRLESEFNTLVRDGEALDRNRAEYIRALRYGGPISLGAPSLPIEVPQAGDVATLLSKAWVKEFVDQLPAINLKDLPIDNHACNICMEPFDSTDEPEAPVLLRCGHIMGRNCIAKWLASSNTCPYCRSVLVDHEAWDPPLTETELMDLLDATHPPDAAEIRDLLQTTTTTTRSEETETDSELIARLERAGVDRGDAEEFEMDLRRIGSQQAVIERVIARLEWEDAGERTVEVEGLEQVLAANEQLAARVRAFCRRHCELIEELGVRVPRVGGRMFDTS